ncbi:hypothetical protein SAY86_008135 [Trapa natans]|uniref:Uncharacterized protein n=1 Tax=Trapa natans TaxID=22666 RepID=A0AAN7KEP4_TRANT|nr:hypothetical protein SAY86_008135 [Trapa natans]
MDSQSAALLVPTHVSRHLTFSPPKSEKILTKSQFVRRYKIVNLISIERKRCRPRIPAWPHSRSRRRRWLDELPESDRAPARGVHNGVLGQLLMVSSRSSTSSSRSSPPPTWWSSPASHSPHEPRR